ncbi:MAG: hypothetical protein ACREAN_05375 [Nitrosopumilaceae archaeon]
MVEKTVTPEPEPKPENEGSADAAFQKFMATVLRKKSESNEPTLGEYKETPTVLPDLVPFDDKHVPREEDFEKLEVSIITLFLCLQVIKQFKNYMPKEIMKVIDKLTTLSQNLEPKRENDDAP